jgi:hypothetical protein
MKHVIRLFSATHILGAILLFFQSYTHASGDFFSKTLQKVRLDSDFSTLFREDFLEAKGFSLPGVLHLQVEGQEWEYDVEVSVRGNTSKYDCSFKKLSLKVDKKAKGPLVGVSKVRINTHCSDNRSGYTDMGRVAGPTGPIREGAVYDWMRALNLPTYLSVVTPIIYTDTGTKKITQSFALVLESKKDLEYRLQGTKVFEEEDIEDQEAFLDRASEIAKNKTTIKGLLFNAMIGNADFSLQLKDFKGERHYNPITPPSGMWNMLALDDTKSIRFVPTDFDVSGAVVQKQTLSDPVIKAISGCQTGFCEFQFSQIQKWRSFFSKAEFALAAQEIQAKSAALKSVINENSNLSLEEKEFFIEYANTFLNLLREYSTIPVITKATRLFLDSELKTACGMENADDGYVINAPAGLPIQLVAKHSKSIQVLLLDTRDGVLSNPDGGSCDGEVFLPKEMLISNDWPN